MDEERIKTNQSISFLIILIVIVVCLFTPKCFHKEKVPTSKVQVQNEFTVDFYVYHPVPGQTDSRPWETASGAVIDMSNPGKHRWIAVSQEMLKRKGGSLKFGDYVRVDGTGSYLDGIWQVQDTMNAKYTKSIDFLQHPTAPLNRGKCKIVKVVK